MFQQTTSQPETVIAQFFIEPVYLAFKSEQEGRPIYEDREHIRISLPGDRLTEIVREATQDDRKRFAAQYDHFKRGHASVMHIGLHLTQWPLISASLAKMLNDAGVYTAEELRDLPDGAGANLRIPNWRELKEKARVYLEDAEGKGAGARAAAENLLLKQQIEDLQRQVALLASRSNDDDGDEDEAPRRRGRPRRVAEAA